MRYFLLGSLSKQCVSWAWNLLQVVCSLSFRSQGVDASDVASRVSGPACETNPKKNNEGQMTFE